LTQFINTDGWDDLFPSRATFYTEQVTGRSNQNKPIASLVAVSGLANLNCQVELGKGDESYGVAGSEAVSTHTITFQQYHEDITEKMICRIEGTDYEILLADADGTRNNSVLKVRRARG
jgi:SPP1 family predicted phage head-tail adaptor